MVIWTRSFGALLLTATLCTTVSNGAQAEAGTGYGPPPAHRLGPGPRVVAPPSAPVVITAPAYLPRPNNLPMYNEPPAQPYGRW